MQPVLWWGLDDMNAVQLFQHEIIETDSWVEIGLYFSFVLFTPGLTTLKRKAITQREEFQYFHDVNQALYRLTRLTLPTLLRLIFTIEIQKKTPIKIFKELPQPRNRMYFFKNLIVLFCNPSGEL